MKAPLFIPGTKGTVAGRILSGENSTLVRRLILTILLLLTVPCWGQDQTQIEEEPLDSIVKMEGYLHQTAMTQESFLVTNPQEFAAFAHWIPPVTPYKTLPAPPNPDPFLKGFTVNFEEDVLIVAVGRNRIKNRPVFERVEQLEDGTREVHFTLTAPTREAYPLGWAVYTAVILPRIEGETTVVVTTVPSTDGHPDSFLDNES